MDIRHEQGQRYEDHDCIIIYVGKLAGNPQWSFPTHKHDDLHEIIYVKEGKGSFTIDGAKHLAQKGDLLIYNKGTLHEEKSDPEDPLSTFYCGFRFRGIFRARSIGSYHQVVNQSFVQTGIQKSCIL